MAENIFNEKQDYIVAARDEVIKRDEYAANIDRMKQQQKKLSRSIASEESQLRMRLRRRSRSADRTFSRPTMTGLMITVHGKRRWRTSETRKRGAHGQTLSRGDEKPAGKR